MTTDDVSTKGGRTPRAEAMRAMVVATVQLLEEWPPDSITIRDVAERSGHHHRFVAGWFGGKVGLYRAAFDQMAEDAADTLMLEPPGNGAGPRPEIARILHLMSWLQSADPTSFVSDRAMPLVAKISQTYRERFGLSASEARLSAQRLAGYFLVTVLFPGPLGVRDGDFAAHLELEARFAESLASLPPGVRPPGRPNGLAGEPE